MVKAKGKGKGKGGDIFKDLKEKRYEELSEIRGRKTTRRTLPKLEKAFGTTASMSPTAEEPVVREVRSGEGGPVEVIEPPLGMGRRRTRKSKKAGRRRTKHRK